MKKLTFKELVAEIQTHNKENNVKLQYNDKTHLDCVIVFKNESWGDTKYSIKARSYKFRSDNKFFIPGMCGTSIFATCLDGSDEGVRLDWYLHKWIIDYCYILN